MDCFVYTRWLLHMIAFLIRHVLRLFGWEPRFNVANPSPEIYDQVNMLLFTTKSEIFGNYSSDKKLSVCNI